MQICSDELLFHGQPAKVLRKCGKAKCKCAQGGESRHGPYHIIRVFRDNKNTQVTIVQDEMHFIEMAKRYQREVLRRKQIVELQKEVLSILDDFLERKTLWKKEEYKENE